MQSQVKAQRSNLALMQRTFGIWIGHWNLFILRKIYLGRFPGQYWVNWIPWKDLIWMMCPIDERPVCILLVASISDWFCCHQPIRTPDREDWRKGKNLKKQILLWQSFIGDLSYIYTWIAIWISCLTWQRHEHHCTKRILVLIFLHSNMPKTHRAMDAGHGNESSPWEIK